ncbi:hypothetical protein GCM10009634_08680 [Saccharothrix xinjiangensis]
MLTDDFLTDQDRGGGHGVPPGAAEDRQGGDDGVACRPSAVDSRMGSTSAMPMNAMTAANAVTHT